VPLRTWTHEGVVYDAVFNGDESRVVTWSEDGTARLWDLSLDETIPLSQRRLELEVRTATTLDESGHVHPLPYEQWNDKRQQLDRLRAGRH
jgi:WD40 repeat protein